MTTQEAMQVRHSVRQYTGQSIESGKLEQLRAEAAACNEESGLHLQVIADEPEAFDNFLAHYGKIQNARNYIALVGKKGKGLDEALGWYGERLVLKAQQMGLNTCWIALTYSRGGCSAIVNKGESMRCVISLGYGVTQGTPHKNKPLKDLCKTAGEPPAWFHAGMAAALLAPTASNQQSFLFTLSGGEVKAEHKGGFYAKMDLGIAKYHFEQGAGKENFTWV